MARKSGIVAATIEVPSNEAAINAALEGLVGLNVVILRQGRGRIPSVYKAGVRWKRDVGETWDTVDKVLERGYGDCEDLAAWRAAELRLQGVKARAIVRPSRTQGVAWHAVVLLPSGQVEDPSRKLGM